MGTQMLQRRGTAAEWAAANPILGEGEIGVEEDTERLKIGDGVTHWADLAIYYPSKQEQDTLYVDIAGDTMVGDLNVGNGVTAATRTVRVNGPAGFSKLIDFQTGGLSRWKAMVSNVAEAGANAGSDFILRAFSDAGANLGDAMKIIRATSQVIFAGRVDAATFYEANQRVYSPNNPQVIPNPFAVIDALGDILVGSGPDAVVRLPKGANNTTLSIDGAGNLGWVAGVDVTTKVSKAGDAMTGELKMDNTVGVRLRGQAGDNAEDIVIFKNAGATALLLRKADRATKVPLDAARIDGTSLYDNGNRVYSVSNPPPVSGMSVLGGATSVSPTSAGATGITFTAPASGRVTIRGASFPASPAAMSTQVSIDNTNFYQIANRTALSSAGYFPNSYGQVTFVGLTPGGSYTVYYKDTSSSGSSFTYSVEG